MKIESNDVHFGNYEHLKALQDKIQEMKRSASPEGGDQANIQFRGKIENLSGDISLEKYSQTLEQINNADQSAQLGDLHANLNMDRVRQLLSPLL